MDSDSRHSRPVPAAEWDRAPWNRWSFQHVREVLPTVEIGRGGGPVRQLVRAERDIGALTVEGIDGVPVTLAAFLEQTFTDGFIVLQDDAVVWERYCNGMDERTLHLSQSVAKSFAGMLAGILVSRGVVDPSAPVAAYVPEFDATAYRDATVRHLLDMTSGVRFDESYTDPFSDMGRLDVAAGWKPLPEGAAETGRSWPRSVFELILDLRTLERPHGERFVYRSIETDVLAFVLERATGRRLAQLLSEEIWQKLGMEQDGNLTIDATGFASADGGLSACLRDYARFGQMILERGGGIVPADWIEATRHGNHATFGSPYTEVLPKGAYRNQFWVEDQESRNLMARGVFGQLIHIDFERRTVIVKLSSWPDFVNPRWTLSTLGAVRRIGAVLSRR